MSQFMLLLRGGAEDWNNLTPEQLQQSMQHYYSWTAELQNAGRFKGGDSLLPGGQTVRNKDGQVTVDGPYTETKEVVSGYYLIEAADIDEATELAKGSPNLNHGGFVEIRQIEVFS